MNNRKKLFEFINKKLEKYFLLTKLDKSFNYRFNGPFNNYYFRMESISIPIKYTLSGFKIGEIQFDVSLNIIVDYEIVVNNKNLLFDEKLKNISDYLDYIIEIENDLDFKKDDKIE